VRWRSTAELIFGNLFWRKAAEGEKMITDLENTYRTTIQKLVDSGMAYIGKSRPEKKPAKYKKNLEKMNKKKYGE
jgi:hypothetical protein